MQAIQLHIARIVLFVLLLCSCEQETTWNLQEGDSHLVVDALITNEFKSHEIKLYYSVNELNISPPPVSGANIELKLSSGEVFQFNESASEAGTYVSPAFAATVNKLYHLIIEYEDIKDSATAYMVPVTPLWDHIIVERDSLYKYYDPGSYQPAMTKVCYDWSGIVEYCNNADSCIAQETFYSLDVTEVNEEFAPRKEQILFPAGTTLIREKHSLTPEHQEFARSLLMETEWRGGFFDVEHGNVPSNFANGTLGWFGVCQVVSDTLVVQ